MNMKKLISTILAATLTVGMCTHIAFGNDFVESLSEEIISAEVETEEIGDIVESKMEVELAFDGGSGTEDNPYLISTAEQFASIAYDNDKYFKLQNDIVLPNEWKYPFTGLGDWRPFYGTFDGAGYTITVSDFKTYLYDGIFCTNEGTIKNLRVHVEPSEKLYDNEGSDYFGIICGVNGGTIENCVIDGTFTYMTAKSYSDYLEGKCEWGNYIVALGGITGENSGMVKNCASNLRIETNFDFTEGIGGIAGVNYAYIENCYSTGTIIAFCSKFTGGLVGANGNSIKNSYSSAIVTGRDKKGCLVGVNGFESTVSNSYYYVPQGAVGDNNIGTSVSLEKLKTRSTYYGWDFVTTWGIDKRTNEGRPYLLSEVYGVNIKLPEVNVGKVEKSVDKEDNKVSVSTTVSNSEERSVPVNVIVAIYDENNVYRGQERVEMVLEPGNNTISLDNISIRKYDPQKKYYGKVMLWDSMYGASPLSDAPIFEIQ